MTISLELQVSGYNRADLVEPDVIVECKPYFISAGDP